MDEIKKQKFEGERSLFSSNNLNIEDCEFCFGESPLKESKNIKIIRSTFKWKYPLWYSQNIECYNVVLEEMARSGIWYTDNIKMENCTLYCPKTFRRASNITLINSQLPNAKETLWGCRNIKINNCKIVGDYLGFNSSDIEVDNIELDGNYLFDGAKNIVVRNSILRSKDSFWNTENVTVINSTIIGEYIGWNSKNVTFINCHIKSHQGFCYMQNVKLIHCELVDSDLCFEYCSDIDAEIISEIDSIKNPYSGIIRTKGVKELIMDEQFVDPSKTEIKIIK